MKIEVDNEFKDLILKKIAEREFSERTGVHSTDLIYCLNKQALRKLQPKESTDEEILTFSLGWSTQRWLTSSFEPEVEFMVDGITVTPDTLVQLGVEEGLNIPWELKTTYQSCSKPIEENAHWIRQILGECYVTGTTTAKLTRLGIMGDWKWVFGKKEEKAEAKHPTLQAWSITFEREELEQFWKWMQNRRDLYQEILATGRLLPKAIAVASGQAFECQWCKYKEECDAAQIVYC